MDMLVRLYALPAAPVVKDATVRVRRCAAADEQSVLDWIGEHFDKGWVSEATSACRHRPSALFVASRNREILGFSVYDATSRGAFGPMGVLETERGNGIGARLLHTALEDMRGVGYAYAVIGWVGPEDFYARVAGATPIEGSDPERGMYRDLLRHDGGGL